MNTNPDPAGLTPDPGMNLHGVQLHQLQFFSSCQSLRVPVTLRTRDQWFLSLHSSTSVCVISGRSGLDHCARVGADVKLNSFQDLVVEVALIHKIHNKRRSPTDGIAHTVPSGCMYGHKCTAGTRENPSFFSIFFPSSHRVVMGRKVRSGSARQGLIPPIPLSAPTGLELLHGTDSSAARLAVCMYLQPLMDFDGL